MRRSLVFLALAAVAAGCGDIRPAASPELPESVTAPALPTTTITSGPAAAATTAPDSSAVTNASPSSSSLAGSDTAAPAAPPALRTPYVIPVAEPSAAGWGDTHSTYPATDIFTTGCGGVIVSPVNGVLLEVRRVDSYEPAVDNPATRGGRSVSILGDDGVRYYLAHFELIGDAIEPGVRVVAGAVLGTVGTTGRSSACHVHFGISPPCPEREWSVRRGVVWPYRYLDDWREGVQTSPAQEVATFIADQPNACRDAAGDANAADA